MPYGPRLADIRQYCQFRAQGFDPVAFDRAGRNDRRMGGDMGGPGTPGEHQGPGDPQ